MCEKIGVISSEMLTDQTDPNYAMEFWGDQRPETITDQIGSNYARILVWSVGNGNPNWSEPYKILI